LILPDGRRVFEEYNKNIDVYSYGITRFSNNLTYDKETLKIMFMDADIDTTYLSLQKCQKMSQ
jgi:hypothetical protein